VMTSQFGQMDQHGLDPRIRIGAFLEGSNKSRGKNGSYYVCKLINFT